MDKHTVLKKDVIMRDDQVVAGYEEFSAEFFSLKGRTAAVTGAGQGMGRSIALGLAKTGADVAVVDLNRKAAAETADRIRALGRKAEIYQADICDESGVQELMKNIWEEFGSLDILVNNAGIGSSSSFPETDTRTWEKVLKVNLDGTFYCSRAAAGYMIRQGRGSIINVGSSLSSRCAVLNCLGGSPEYCVSKSGIQALTRSMAQYLARYGIRANAVAPGPVDSPMHADRREELALELVRVPLGRIQNCDDVVGPVVFLASEAARFVTGQILHVNGGMLMTD